VTWFMDLFFAPHAPIEALGLFSLFLLAFLTGLLLGILLAPSQLRFKNHLLQAELRQLRHERRRTPAYSSEHQLWDVPPRPPAIKTTP
jgi:hypothetical protein